MDLCFVSTPSLIYQRRHQLPLRNAKTKNRTIPRCSTTASQPSPTSRFTRRNFLQTISGLGLAATLPPPTLASARNREPDFLYDSRSGSFVPPSAMDALLRRDQGSTFDRCIVAGEIHDNMRTHDAQLSVIDSARRMDDGRQLVVGFEQFYRMHNFLLDAYLKGDISIDSLLRRTDWETTWGYDTALYVPIFEYCRNYQIPMRGLNVSQLFTSAVKEYGIQHLPEKLNPFLPDNMDFENRAHYDHFVSLLSAGNVHLSMQKAVIDRYYEVQVFWEEWMSQSVALTLQNSPDTRMVALIGSGHVEGRYGFPDRIEKRCNERPYTIVPRPVQWTRDDGIYLPNISKPEENIADLIWYTR